MLHFNGGDIRDKFFIDLYIAALYAETLNKHLSNFYQAQRFQSSSYTSYPALFLKKNASSPIDGLNQATQGKNSLFEAQIASFLEGLKMKSNKTINSHW